MSENYKFYEEKMVQKRAARPLAPRLHKQLEEILSVVRECEARWAMEDRIDRQLGPG